MCCRSWTRQRGKYTDVFERNEPLLAHTPLVATQAHPVVVTSFGIDDAAKSYRFVTLLGFDSSTGLNRADAASTGEDGVWGYASAIATAVREKILECSGASEENGTMVLFGVGAVGAALAAFALYLLSLYFDRDPFLFNGGKMGKLEAQSIYTKKSC